MALGTILYLRLLLTFACICLPCAATQIHYAAAIRVLFGQLLHIRDLGGHEDSLVTRRVGNRHVDQHLLKILSAALEAQATAGHVFACDHIVGQSGAAHAGFEVDAGARMFSPVLTTLFLYRYTCNRDGGAR